MLKKIFISINWLFFEQFLKLSLGLSVTIVIIRYLGPADYGLINYCLSVCFILATIAKLGMDDIAVKEFTKNNYDSDVFNTFISLRIISSTITFLVGLILSFIIFENEEWVIFFIISLTIFISFFDQIEMLLRSKVEGKYIAISKIIGLLISSILRLYFVYISLSVTYFAFLILVEAALIYFIFVFFLNKKLNIKIFFKFDLSEFKKILLKSWPLMISGISVIIYMRIDQIMITNFVDVESNGYYSFAIRIVEILFIFPTIIVNTIFPLIIKNEYMLGFSIQRTLYLFMFYSSVIISLIMSFFAEKIILTIGGIQYQESLELFRYLIWLLPLVSLGVARSKWVVKKDLQKNMLLILILGATINTLLNIYFIKHFGTIGAVYTSLITTFLIVFILPVFSKDLKKSVKDIVCSIFFLIRNKNV